MTGTLKKMSKHTNKVRAMVIQWVFKSSWYYCVPKLKFGCRNVFYYEQVLSEVQEAKEKLTKLEEKAKKQVSAVFTQDLKILQKSIAQTNNNRVL